MMDKKRKKKRAKRVAIPPDRGGTPPGKVTKIAAEVVSIDKRRPVWCISKLQVAPPFGWQSISGAQFWQKIFPRLRSFETMTWGDILGPDSHAVPVSGLVREARKILDRMRLSDMDEVISLRVQKKQRVWGIRTPDGVFHLLWWDPNHDVWDDGN
jgi:hypothetical protein